MLDLLGCMMLRCYFTSLEGRLQLFRYILQFITLINFKIVFLLFFGIFHGHNLEGISLFLNFWIGSLKKVCHLKLDLLLYFLSLSFEHERLRQVIEHPVNISGKLWLNGESSILFLLLLRWVVRCIFLTFSSFVP